MHTETAVAAAAPSSDEDDKPIERLVFRGNDIVLAFASVASGCARRLLTTALVKLDVGGTRLDDAGLATVIAASTPWLRELSAAGKCNVTRSG